MEPYNYTLEELPGALQEAFDDAGKEFFDEATYPVTVHKMTISFV